MTDSLIPCPACGAHVLGFDWNRGVRVHTGADGAPIGEYTGDPGGDVLHADGRRCALSDLRPTLAEYQRHRTSRERLDTDTVERWSLADGRVRLKIRTDGSGGRPRSAPDDWDDHPPDIDPPGVREPHRGSRR